MKRSLTFLAVFILLIAAAGAAVMGVISSSKGSTAESKIKKDLTLLSNTEVSIENLRVEKSPASWKRAVVKIEKIEIKNPSGDFTSPAMAIVKDIEIDCDLLSLMLGRWRIYRLFADVDKSYIEVDGAGGFNINRIPALQITQAGAPKDAGMQFEIQRLELKLGSVYYVDPKNTAAPEEPFAFDDKLEVFDHVRDPGILFQAPVLTYLSRINKGSLGLSRGLIQENVKRHIGTPELNKPAV